MEVLSTQGLEDLTGFKINLLYPNPNKGTFEIEILGVIGDHVDGKLFTAEGKLVSSFLLGAANGTVKTTVEMSRKLAAGKYFLGVYNENRASILPFIRE